MAKVERAALPGGELPDIGKLITETFEEFIDNIGPYALAGLGLMLIQIPVVIIGIIGIYIGMFGSMGAMFAMMLGFGGILAATLGEDFMVLGIIVGEILGFVVMFVVIVGLSAMMGAALAPINASLVRATAAHQRGEKDLDFSAAFSTITENIMGVVLAAICISLMVFAGLMFCYLPALLVPFFFGFVASMVALHRSGVGTAMKANFGHVTTNFVWHIPYFALYFAILMVSGYIPVVGSMFAIAFHTRAHRYLFGDGHDPEIAGVLEG